MYSQLKSGQVFHKDDYLTDNGIHYNRKTVVFDGSDDEEWKVNNTNALRYTIGIDMADIKQKDGSVSNQGEGNLLCNQFIFSNSGEGYAPDKDRYTFRKGAGYNTIWFFTPKSYFTATTSDEILAEWKEKLKANPLVVEYLLEEEDIEPYSEAQQKAYEQIKNAKSYKGITHILSEDEIKPILEVEAFADISNSINTKEKIVEEIKEESEEKI